MWWIRSSALLAAVELDPPGRGLGHGVGGVVGAVVVPGAQRDAVFDVRLAAVDPAGAVVGVEAGAAVAAFGSAALVADQDRDALVLGVEPALAAHIQRHRLATQDGRDDPRLTGEPSRHGGGDLLAGVEGAGLLEAPHEQVLAAEDEEGGVEA